MITSFSLLADNGADQQELLRTLALLAARVRPLPEHVGEMVLIGPGNAGPLTAWMAGRGGLQRLNNDILVEYRSRWHADFFAVVAPDPDGGGTHAAVIAAVVGDHRAARMKDTFVAFGRIGCRQHPIPADSIAYPDGSWLRPLSVDMMDPDELYRLARLTLFDLGLDYAREQMRRRAAKPGHPTSG